MTRIILYGQHETPFTRKVERTLRFKKLEYTLREPESPEDFRRWSPETGLLPAAEIDGEHVHDSGRIINRLDELFPQPPLLADDPKIADAQRRLENWCDETFFFYWLRWNRLRKQEAMKPSRSFGLGTWLRELASATAPVPRVRSRDGLSPEAADLAEQVGRRCDDLVNILAGRPYFYADRPGRADLAVYVMLESMREGSMPRGAQIVLERPSLMELMGRVEDATGGSDL